MKQLLLILFFFVSVSTLAQTGIGTTNPDPSAQLEVSSTTKGFLPPRMDKTQRDNISSPADGLIIFQTGEGGGLYVYISGEWVRADVSDLNIGTDEGEMEYWDGTAWVSIMPGTQNQVLTVNGSGIPIWSDAPVSTVYFEDADGDGFGNVYNHIVAVSAPDGYVDNYLDCNDTDPDEFPGQVWYKDEDGDNFYIESDVVSCSKPANHFTYAEVISNGGEFGDCNDTDSSQFPGQVWYIDQDNDGYGRAIVVSCLRPTHGRVSDVMSGTGTDDCNDTNNKVYPGAPEICDGLDNNCNGQIDEGLTFTLYYVDADRDGYGNINDTGTLFCKNPGVGYSLTNDDCDDSNPAINPGAYEDPNDGIDNNCNGQTDELSVGQFIGGGIVFYIAPTPTDLNGDGTLNTGLVCAIEDQGSIQWWRGFHPHLNVPGAKATAISAGLSNTNAIIQTQGGNPTNYAAGLARAYNGGGFNDWFLPSLDALSEMHANQGHINTASVSNGGSVLQQGWRWSSSQHITDNAWVWRIWFGGGCNSCGTAAGNAANENRVRAVRAF